MIKIKNLIINESFIECVRIFEEIKTKPKEIDITKSGSSIYQNESKNRPFSIIVNFASGNEEKIEGLDAKDFLGQFNLGESNK